MSTSRLSLIASLLLVACPADDADDGAGTNTDPGSSSTSPSTTEPGSESSTLGTTEPGSSSSTDPSGSESSTSAVDESSTAAVDESSSTGEPIEFTVTSPEFTDGMGLPHTAHIDGGNISPALDWVGAPDGTMSFGVFLHDLDFLGGNPNGFSHSAIWDISADATGLPADVDHDPMPADVPGAVQCKNWNGSFGYGGPGSDSNHYEFIVYALDTETLPMVDSNSSLAAVYDALEAHSLGTAKIVGQSTGDGM